MYSFMGIVINSYSYPFIYVHSDNDPYIPIEQAKFLSTESNGKLIELEGQGHFNTESNSDYKQFPELIEIIENIV